MIEHCDRDVKHFYWGYETPLHFPWLPFEANGKFKVVSGISVVPESVL